MLHGTSSSGVGVAAQASDSKRAPLTVPQVFVLWSAWAAAVSVQAEPVDFSVVVASLVAYGAAVG